MMSEPNPILAARRKLKVSQAGLAKLLGLHQASISRYEIGKCRIPGPVLIALDVVVKQRTARKRAA